MMDDIEKIKYCRTFINQQFTSIESSPAMWGTNREIELQYILLLEFLVVVENPEFDINDNRFVIELWSSFKKTKEDVDIIEKLSDFRKYLIDYMEKNK